MLKQWKSVNIFGLILGLLNFTLNLPTLGNTIHSFHRMPCNAALLCIIKTCIPLSLPWKAYFYDFVHHCTSDVSHIDSPLKMKM